MPETVHAHPSFRSGRQSVIILSLAISIACQLAPLGLSGISGDLTPAWQESGAHAAAPSRLSAISIDPAGNLVLSVTGEGFDPLLRLKPGRDGAYRVIITGEFVTLEAGLQANQNRIQEQIRQKLPALETLQLIEERRPHGGQEVRLILEVWQPLQPQIRANTGSRIVVGLVGDRSLPASVQAKRRAQTALKTAQTTPDRPPEPTESAVEAEARRQSWLRLMEAEAKRLQAEAEQRKRLHDSLAQAVQSAPSQPSPKPIVQAPTGNTTTSPASPAQERLAVRPPERPAHAPTSDPDPSISLRPLSLGEQSKSQPIKPEPSPTRSSAQEAPKGPSDGDASPPPLSSLLPTLNQPPAEQSTAPTLSGTPTDTTQHTSTIPKTLQQTTPQPTTSLTRPTTTGKLPTASGVFKPTLDPPPFAPRATPSETVYQADHVPPFIGRPASEPYAVYAWVYAQRGRPNEVIQQAWQHLQRDNTTAAELTLRRHLETNPDDQAARYLLARTLLRTATEELSALTIQPSRDTLAKREAARSELLKIVSNQSDLPAYTALLELYLEDGHLEEAKRLWDKVQRQYPLEPLAFYGQARIHEALDELPEARRHYAQALAGQPGNPELHYRLAQVEMKAGQLDSARWELNQALYLSPDDVRIWKLMGYLAEQQGDTQRALQLYREALQPDVLLNYGRMLEARNEPEKALVMYDTVHQLADKDPDLLFNLGMIYSRMPQQGQRAEKALKRFLEISDNTKDSRIARAKSTLQQISGTHSNPNNRTRLLPF